MDLLDLDIELVKQDFNNHLILGGSLVPQYSKPIANCYCGYQFGNWAGQVINIIYYIIAWRWKSNQFRRY